MFTSTEINAEVKNLKAAFETIAAMEGDDGQAIWTGGFLYTGSFASTAATNGDRYGRDFPEIEPVLWLQFDFSDSVSASGWCRLTDELDPLSMVVTADPIGDPEGSEGI